MSKRKTSINVDDKLWREWSKFVVDRRGSFRKISEELENAMREYMERHKDNAKTES
jgi:metal-responsive CopG/Arc/MetJ family transcriptional regulator